MGEKITENIINRADQVDIINRIDQYDIINRIDQLEYFVLYNNPEFIKVIEQTPERCRIAIERYFELKHDYSFLNKGYIKNITMDMYEYALIKSEGSAYLYLPSEICKDINIIKIAIINSHQSNITRILSYMQMNGIYLDTIPFECVTTMIDKNPCILSAVTKWNDKLSMILTLSKIAMYKPFAVTYADTKFIVSGDIINTVFDTYIHKHLQHDYIELISQFIRHCSMNIVVFSHILNVLSSDKHKQIMFNDKEFIKSFVDNIIMRLITGADGNIRYLDLLLMRIKSRKVLYYYSKLIPNKTWDMKKKFIKKFINIDAQI